MKREHNFKLKSIFIIIMFVTFLCSSTMVVYGVEFRQEKIITERDGVEYEQNVAGINVKVGTSDTLNGLTINATSKAITYSYNGRELPNLQIYSVTTNAAGVPEHQLISTSFTRYQNENGEIAGYVMEFSSFGPDGDGFSEGDLICFSYIDDEGQIQYTEPMTMGEAFSGDFEVHEIDEGSQNKGFWATIWGLITDTADELQRILEELLVDLFLIIGDGIHYLICSSVGEVVTTDRIIFNGVSKIDANYWEESSNPNSVKGIMSKVISAWYPFFYKIGIIVYMIILVFVGMQVVINSTADKKAKYKEVMVSWVTGVAMLTLFPFAMKYIIVLNNTGVSAMATFIGVTNESGEITPFTPGILTSNDVKEVTKKFGKVDYVQSVTQGTIYNGSAVSINKIKDTMLMVRTQAQIQKKFVLVIIFYIMMIQMLVLLFMYYKRAFMLAFLITIYPLVAASYVVDKVSDKKAQSFGIWFKEYVINIVVQIFHAAVYVTIVDIAIGSYINSGGRNWLFTVISVLFLFQGEKILRGIFNAKSSANTIGDLAAIGASIWAARKLLPSKNDKSGNASKSDMEDVEGIKERAETRRSATTGGQPHQPNAPERPGSGGSGSGENEHLGNDTGDNPRGVDTNKTDLGAAQDKVASSALGRRLKAGIASKVAGGSIRMGGKLLGATYAMAKGNTTGGGSMISNIVADSATAEAIADLPATAVSSAINKFEQASHGEKEGKAIESGQMDAELGLAGDAPIIPPNVDPNEVIGKNGETIQELYRKALAEMARVSARKGKTKGEVAFWNYIDDHTNPS